MDATPRLALPYLAPAQAQKHVTVNEALRRLDALVHAAAVSRTMAQQPAEPADGEAYILPEGAGGADWSAMPAGAIASFQDGAWAAVQPKAGWRVYIADAGEIVVHDGETWRPLGDILGAVQALARLGLGTEADAAAPFAAKLNAALWTARYAAEGGDGDLRQVLNKEAPENTLSLRFETAWSPRAELGLAGDDDLTLKVSPDGENWTEAMRVDRESGRVDFSNGIHIARVGDVVVDVQLEGGTGSVFRATRYSNNAAAPVFFGRKARGGAEAPEAVQGGDTLIGFRGYGYTGEDFVSGSAGVSFLLEAAQNWVHESSYGTQVRFFVTPNDSTTQMEHTRFANDGSLQMGGENAVIDAKRHHRLRPYTVAALPSPDPAGQMIFLSNGDSNRHLAISDGTDWRWPDGNVVL